MPPQRRLIAQTATLKRFIVELKKGGSTISAWFLKPESYCADKKTLQRNFSYIKAASAQI